MMGILYIIKNFVLNIYVKKQQQGGLHIKSVFTTFAFILD